MNSFINVKVDSKYDGYKLQVFMREVLDFSSRFCTKSTREGRVKINNGKATLYTKLFEGDTVSIDLPEEDKSIIEPDKIDLNILYEDDLYIAVEKKPFMVVHPTLKCPRETLLNGIAYYFNEKGIKTMPRLVSRLDRDTSGVIVIAKNSFAHMKLAKAMESKLFKKEYIAIVHGALIKSKEIIDKPIGKSEDGIKRIIDENGKKSVTEYNLVSKNEKASLVKLNLITGRTHQIRLHMSSVGHPLYGDSLYGEEEPEFIDRQALHAYYVHFPHPLENRIVEIKCQIPNDMKNLIEKLEL